MIKKTKKKSQIIMSFTIKDTLDHQHHITLGWWENGNNLITTF